LLFVLVFFEGRRREETTKQAPIPQQQIDTKMQTGKLRQKRIAKREEVEPNHLAERDLS